MMLIFYFFAAIAVWLGVVSMRGGLLFLAYVRREQERVIPDYMPFVSVVAPLRGVDRGLKENLAALFEQEYPSYEILFVTDSIDDAALPLVEKLRGAVGSPHGIASRVIVAGQSIDCGQKVHNLRRAVSEIDRKSEVIVFVDTDARPHSQWLRSLVAPLNDKRVGAATGYRWFIPTSNSLAAHLLSVWNGSIASALGKNDRKNFCWGGSTAIRRETFEELRIADRWRGTVSDDFTLTRVLHEADLPIHFVPACLTESFEDCGWRELLEFTNRQLKITRVYASHLWRAVLLGSSIFVLVFFGGVGLTAIRASLGLSVIAPLIFLGIIFLLGAAKALIRLRAVRIAMVNYDSRIVLWPAHLLLWPFASALFLYNALAAAASRRIKWRGISYELKSPTEAVIITREITAAISNDAE
jgi:ceramide glucosyltransferase